MAWTEIFVDPALAGDTGSGTRATITLTAATFTTGTWNLAEVGAFSSYTWASGDTITITGGTNVNAGNYEIASRTDDDNIVLTGDITSDVSSPVDVTAASAPYGDLEYAIEQETFDTTNGTRVNIKAGTDEILAADLAAAIADTSVSVAWVPGITAPLIFQGYTTTAGDGGTGGVSGGGSVGVLNNTSLDYTSFIDLHLHNCGAAVIVDINNWCNFIRVEADNSSGGGLAADADPLFISCYVYNVSDFACKLNGGVVAFCLLENGTNKVSSAINTTGSAFITRNVIIVDSGSDGISCNNISPWIEHNSIYSAGGTGQGIVVASTRRASIVNNIVEGFSGAGGIGYDIDAATVFILSYGGNTSYDNETHYTTSTIGPLDDFGDNEILTASAFTDAANNNFSPIATGNVKEGALPQIIGGGFV